MAIKAGLDHSSSGSKNLKHRSIEDDLTVKDMGTLRV
jgi:hypothetical protein